MLPYLTASPKQPMLADYLDHLDHAVKVMGEDHVGVGTDVPFLRLGAAGLEQMKQAIEQRKASGIGAPGEDRPLYLPDADRKSTRLNSSHANISYAVFCLKKKTQDDSCG